MRVYSHILPPADRRLNVLPRYRDQFYASHHSKLKFHQFFHHLNSSQALCINLFYPLIAEHQLDLLTGFLGMSADSYPEPTFEKASELENGKRRTNFDFHLHYADGNEVFFEVKYTERQFGKARNDSEHWDKFEATYLPLLLKNPYLVEKCKNQDFFLANYQVLRNLIHTGSNARIVFLIPSIEFKIATEISKFIDELLTDDGKSLVQIVFLDVLVNYFVSRCRDPLLKDYFRAFSEKYLPPAVFGHAPNTGLQRTAFGRR